MIQADATTPPFAAETFDAVLVDAPCSGLGALRRRPDARWRIDEQAIERLVPLQAALLDAAVGLLAPGGVLVYSVCTLTEAELTDPVARVVGHDTYIPLGPAANEVLPSEDRIEAAARELLEARGAPAAG